MKKVLFFWLNAVYIFASCQNAELELYLIPKGFEGQVFIVFNQPQGQPKTYEKSRRVFDTTGVLLTQFSPNYGFINWQYAYIDSIGQQTILRKFNDKNLTTDENEIGIFKRAEILHGNLGAPNSIETQEFIVASKKNVNFFTTPEYQKKCEDKLRKKVGHDF
jgi:hypothetical protein